ncbi:zinc-binding metallopeptidase family protein [Algiphilus sp.]|uniref:zinc-binding metallopeptidase family protein n=1 Tax=Algiphilus sp. TaxID=1872431 RepID=UPI003B52FD10
MRVFGNPEGSDALWFDNLVTSRGLAVAYNPDAMAFTASQPFCVNRALLGCNWTAAGPNALCRSCAMTHLAPDPSIQDAIPHWAKAEAAKRWALDNLARWGWFSASDPGPSPAFHMLAEGALPITMGHSQGVVTISVAEGDPILLTMRREALFEPYRTMLGHMRHEMSHVLWWRLSVRTDFLDAFRAEFGDERRDYGEALQAYYDNGPPPQWEQAYLTSYAASHPHEDWAETVAHLLHLTDIADSFVASGLWAPQLPSANWDPYAEADAERLIHTAAGLTVGMNHVNRAMGLSDLYPFILSERARRKLHFAHQWLSGAQSPS